jgi:hypothetical protein
MKSGLSLLIFCSLLASCSGSRDKKVEDLAFARSAVFQSTDAYQICTEQNIESSEKCSALIKLMEADQKRVTRLTTN